MLDRIPLHRIVAGATLLSPLALWLYMGFPWQLSIWTPIPLHTPVTDLSVCVLVLFLGVYLDGRSAWWQRAQWVAVGALLAGVIVWGFFVGRLFTAPGVLAAMSAVLANGNMRRRALHDAEWACVGIALQLFLLTIAGYHVFGGAGETQGWIHRSTR